jgi:hypothetical protein
MTSFASPLPRFLLAVLPWIAACSHQVVVVRAPERNPSPSAAAAVDKEGNRILVGAFFGELGFDRKDLVSEDGSEAYVVKVGSDGSLIWAKVLGGPGHQRATGVAVDARNDILVAGISEEEVAGKGRPPSPLKESVVNPAVFVAKLDSGGNVVWRKIVARVVTESVSVALGPDGRAHIGMAFWGDGSAGDKAIRSSGDSSALLATLDGEGNLEAQAVLAAGVMGACCPHSVCKRGCALHGSCEGCAGKVCSEPGMSYCCTSTWDQTCIDTAKWVCNKCN